MIEIAIEELGYVSFSTTKVFGQLGFIHVAVLHKRRYLAVEFHLKSCRPICWTLENFFARQDVIFFLFQVSEMPNRGSSDDGTLLAPPSDEP